MALQTYFRATTNFTYDTRVAPSRSDDAVWDFLQSKQGYCVQFATSMAMMARTLGIPARVGVGFLPGESDRNGSYVVTGHESHAWPELFFEGYGWVRFEPTPAVQTGAPPRWSDPFRASPRRPTSPTTSCPSSRPLATAPAATDQPAGRRRSRPTPAAPGCPSGSPSRSCSPSPRSGWRSSAAAPGSAPTSRRSAPGCAPRKRLAARGVTWTDADTPRTVVASVQEQLRGWPGHR